MDTDYLLHHASNVTVVALVAISAWCVLDKPTSLFYFLVGGMTSMVVNLIVKNIVRQKRPVMEIKQAKMRQYFRDMHMYYRNGVNVDYFGMPSGHTQTAFFALTFDYLVLHHVNLAVASAIAAVFIAWQRYVSMHHSIPQILVGAALGVAMGFLFSHMAKSSLQGNMARKKCDHCLLPPASLY